MPYEFVIPFIKDILLEVTAENIESLKTWKSFEIS